jgi:hypothetical protein
LLEVMEEVRRLLSNEDNDSTWSSWDDRMLP